MYNLAIEATQTSILNWINDLTTCHWNRLKGILEDETIQKLSKTSIYNKSNRFDIGLNLFTLISDVYHKENFHSDIMKEIINPDGKHKEGDRFLELFLRYLKTFPKAADIIPSDYKNSLVEREKGRIDIAIKDTSSRKAIIIENKINGAQDTYRQLPTYVEYLENNGFIVEAIVYLVLDNNKMPSPKGWTDKERSKINQLLIPVCAYNRSPKDLYNGWLLPSQHAAENGDTQFLIRQYSNLINHLGEYNMDNILMEEFLCTMLKDKNYETALSFRGMVNDLIPYRRNKIIEHFKMEPHPFGKVWPWNNTPYAVFDHLFHNDHHFAIDVIVEEMCYRVQFFERGYVNLDNVDGILNPSEEALKDIQMFSLFKPAGRRFEKIFAFPSEEKSLYAFIHSMQQKLSTYLKPGQ